ncbi:MULTISPECIES: hypothetical protein [Mycobacteriaceae]|uniref:hypothetical protein n=1 Tax=Mycobacteriaceae TaxID=1762 RepID=UPI0007FD0DD3|nr:MULTISPECIES: hypothetical protein [Mycobacteriaceae]MCK0174317.1 hypothetical protein [Mycolicibacterium sp. F2034L]OBB60343.1 hypothetical protein A5757_09635 [Mycobacterium sp. 852013-51886_SCH5428379]
MRIAVLVATAVLAAGCSQGVDGQPEPEPSQQSAAAAAQPTVTSSPPASPSLPPAAAAPVGEVITWIEAAPPAPVDGFRSVSRDGAATDLGDGVAFVTPSGTSKCVTDGRAGGALTCLVDLSDPPPQPADVYGEWKGGWVDYPGPTLTVGSAHADAGPFAAGFGAELPYGQALNFGDYRCRADEEGLFCVNYAHRSAVRLSNTGVGTFGCLQPEPTPADVGARFSC